MARARDLNLLIFYGHALDEPTCWGWTYNVIFDLVNQSRVDGVIAVSATLATHSGAEAVRRLLDRYWGMPLCSVGVAIPDVPSVVVDNLPGMTAVLEHVIRDHGRRRIALLTGSPQSPEAKLRLDACRNVFEQQHIPWDESLVECGYFVTTKGQAALSRILDRTDKLDAVVAANDAMALGAIEALRDRGRRVPEDVLVAGFDDLLFAALGNPSLTTVAQPFEAIAQWAIAAVVDQLAGKPVALVESLATDLVVRASCGCQMRLTRASGTVPSATDSNPQALLRRQWHEFEHRLSEEMAWSSSQGRSGACALLSALDSELSGTVGSLENALDKLLRQAQTDIQRLRQIQNSLTMLHEMLRDDRVPRLVNMWFRAINHVASATVGAMVQQQLARVGEYLRVLATSEQVSGAFDLPSLRRALVDTLPGIGIKTIYLSPFWVIFARYTGTVRYARSRRLTARCTSGRLKEIAWCQGAISDSIRRA